MQLQLTVTMFAIYFFEMHRKNGISLLVDAPRGVKMALKEDSEGSTEHHKVITFLKLCITNLENGIWIVT